MVDVVLLWFLPLFPCVVCRCCRRRCSFFFYFFLPFSVHNLLSLKDGLTQHQAEQSYSSSFPRCRPSFFPSPRSHHLPTSSSSPLFFPLFFFGDNPLQFFFFVCLSEQLGAEKKVFFGFDLSINRKSLKCPFFFLN